MGAVGGISYGAPGGGLPGGLQRIEFRRYAREIARYGYRANMLAGTATVFRVSALRRSGRARLDGLIGGGTSYYSLASLTEDPVAHLLGPGPDRGRRPAGVLWDEGGIP
ncbi:hypothetical protein [Kitasatospora sp. NPDC090091]|uniref:hypothetical protein n=1 Tax=Kitasatospora sp. NPDC090091 TaxID=3364081 RepID=UPI0037F13CD9